MTTQTDVPMAKDFMSRHVQTIDSEMSLLEIADFLFKHEVSNAPVVEKLDDGRKHLVGFVSEGDILEHLANETFYGSPNRPFQAGTIMKRHPVCVDANADIFSLASVFVSHRFRHLPVVEDGALVGIVSRRDILHALVKYLRARGSETDSMRNPPDLSQLKNLRFLLQGR